MIKRYCKICGVELSKNNKSGFCRQHLDRSGKNNSFYGKHHTKETKEKLRIKCKEATKKMWQNKEYREKVIKNATGVKRGDDFRETQRKHALKQFEDNSQRQLRSEMMSNNWKNGILTCNRHESINESKQERKFMEIIESMGYVISFDSFLYKESGKKRHLFPDGIIEDDKIIIEYNGSFWHADPKRGYKPEDVIHHNKTAQEIWDNDKKKVKIYKKHGYSTFVVWSDEFLKDKDKVIKKFNKFVDKIRKQILKQI